MPAHPGRRRQSRQPITPDGASHDILHRMPACQWFARLAADAQPRPPTGVGRVIDPRAATDFASVLAVAASNISPVIHVFAGYRPSTSCSRIWNGPSLPP